MGTLPTEDAPSMKIVPVHVKELIQRLVELHSLLAVHGVCTLMVVSLVEAQAPGDLELIQALPYIPTMKELLKDVIQKEDI